MLVANTEQQQKMGKNGCICTCISNNSVAALEGGETNLDACSFLQSGWFIAALGIAIMIFLAFFFVCCVYCCCSRKRGGNYSVVQGDREGGKLLQKASTLAAPSDHLPKIRPDDPPVKGDELGDSAIVCEEIIMSSVPLFSKSNRGGDVLIHEGYEYLRDGKNNEMHWRCRKYGCTVRLKLHDDVATLNRHHSHELDEQRAMDRAARVVEVREKARAKLRRLKQKLKDDTPLERKFESREPYQSSQLLPTPPRKFSSSTFSTAPPRKRKSDLDAYGSFTRTYPSTSLPASATGMPSTTVSYSTANDAGPSGSQPTEEKFGQYIIAMLETLSPDQKKRYMQAIRKTIAKLDLEGMDEDSGLQTPE